MKDFMGRWGPRQAVVCGVFALGAFYGDGVTVVDMALAKIFRLPWQGQSMAVRLEGYNVFNWVQFGFPVNDITSPTFGRINGTATQYAPRTVQVVLRYRY